MPYHESDHVLNLLAVPEYHRFLTPRCQPYRPASPQGFSCRPSARGGLTVILPCRLAAIGKLYTPVDALDFHRHLPEMFGTVGRTPKGMTAAAREQRKRGDGQVWPRSPGTHRAREKRLLLTFA
jgi:hypothetical protein